MYIHRELLKYITKTHAGDIFHFDFDIRKEPFPPYDSADDGKVDKRFAHLLEEFQKRLATSKIDDDQIILRLKLQIRVYEYQTTLTNLPPHAQEKAVLERYLHGHSNYTVKYPSHDSEHNKFIIDRKYATVASHFVIRGAKKADLVINMCDRHRFNFYEDDNKLILEDGVPLFRLKDVYVEYEQLEDNEVTLEYIAHLYKHDEIKLVSSPTLFIIQINNKLI